MITPSFSLTATERVLPKLALDFTTASLDSRVTFTRTTDATHPATYVNSSGILSSATNNQPRFDYDASTLICKGLLIEESRENKITYSSDYTQTGWTLVAGGTRSYLTSSATTSPDGTSNASKIYTGVFSSLTAGLFKAFTYAATTTYTISCFVKNAGYQWIYFGTDNVAGKQVWFDVQNGIVGNASSNYSGAITNFGNGWYRVSVTFTTGTAATSNTILLGLANGNGNTNVTGDGSSGVYSYGWQIEAGAFATSYIPTTTTALTRNADVATMTGTNFSGWFNASEGAFDVMFDAIGATPASSFGLISVGNSVNANNTIIINAVYNGVYRTRLFGYNSTILDVSVYPSTTYTANTFVNVCYAYKANNYSGALGGNSVDVDTVGNVPSVVNMVIGAYPDAAGNFLNGHVARINYYSQRITNSEVQAFSKG